MNKYINNNNKYIKKLAVFPLSVESPVAPTILFMYVDAAFLRIYVLILGHSNL